MPKTTRAIIAAAIVVLALGTGAGTAQAAPANPDHQVFTNLGFTISELGLSFSTVG